MVQLSFCLNIMLVYEKQGVEVLFLRYVVNHFGLYNNKAIISVHYKNA